MAALTMVNPIVIRPGEQVPADGDVAEGASSMNEAFLTGESRPVQSGRRRGDRRGRERRGRAHRRITRTGDATTLSQIMRLVDEAQVSRSRFQALADRAAFWFTMIAIGVSVPTSLPG